MWREAKALLVLLDQVNALWPNRSKASDGEIGDQAHQARKSDHDPDKDGVVTAIDITNDPVTGPASHALAEVLVASRDPRIKYIISHGLIVNSRVSPWAWRPYHGANGHFHHVHISVFDVPKLYDDATPWNIGTSTKPTMPLPAPLTLKNGDIGMDVKALQTKLGIKADGIFGDGTEKAVRAFQASHNLREDGIVGALTRKEIGI